MIAACSAVAASAAPVPEPLPTYTQAYEPRTVDERGVWMQADEYERVVRDSALLVRDEPLTAYVKHVLCETVGAERCRSVRPYVIENPEFNAAMAPNGMLFVNTGLLLRMRDEAEFASVLGHEFAHFELRHGLEKLRQRRNAASAAAWIGVLGQISNTDTRDLRQSLVLSIPQFSREEETAADLLSARYLARSTYPASVASEVWLNVVAEDEARAIGRGLKPKRKLQAGYLDSHPPSAQRAVYLKAASDKYGAGGSALRAAEFRTMIKPHLSHLLDAQVRSNDFGGSTHVLEQLAAGAGWTGDLLFARAQLYRQRGAPRDLETAAQFLHEAIDNGYANPVAHRELGLSLLRNGDRTGGRNELAAYLKQMPNADDRSMIEAMLQD